MPVRDHLWGSLPTARTETQGVPRLYPRRCAAPREPCGLAASARRTRARAAGAWTARPSNRRAVGCLTTANTNQPSSGGILEPSSGGRPPPECAATVPAMNRHRPRHLARQRRGIGRGSPPSIRDQPLETRAGRLVDRHVHRAPAWQARMSRRVIWQIRAAQDLLSPPPADTLAGDRRTGCGRSHGPLPLPACGSPGRGRRSTAADPVRAAPARTAALEGGPGSHRRRRRAEPRQAAVPGIVSPAYQAPRAAVRCRGPLRHVPFTPSHSARNKARFDPNSASQDNQPASLCRSILAHRHRAGSRNVGPINGSRNWQLVGSRQFAPDAAMNHA